MANPKGTKPPRDSKGKFLKGHNYSPATQFKKGEHWRKDQPFRHRFWLEREYILFQRSMGEIAEQFGVTDSAIQYWLRKHDIPCRSTSESRSVKHWGATGENNAMYGLRKEDSNSWKGGITPERQAFYSSIEWKRVFKKVWKRDHSMCQRCKKLAKETSDLDVHHVIPFEVKEYRSDINNLVLLCEACHGWVHSSQNINREWIKEAP